MEGTGDPPASLLWATSSSASVVPTTAVCPSPDTIVTWLATCWTDTDTVAETDPAIARTVVAPLPVAVTTPVALAVATAGSSLVQETIVLKGWPF